MDTGVHVASIGIQLIRIEFGENLEDCSINGFTFHNSCMFVHYKYDIKVVSLYILDII